MTLKQENKLKKNLKSLGWGFNFKTRDWISPYTFIEYSFEQAIRIEDCVNQK